MEIVLHDYFEYPDGGGRLALILSSILNAHIGYGFKKSNHPFFINNYNIEKEYDLKSFNRFPIWKQLSIICAFLFKSQFIENYDTVFYSGSYAPLSVNHHSKGLNIYYCHTPPRFLYDQKELFLSFIPFWQKPIYKAFLHYYQKYYQDSVAKMDVIIANSINVKKRIKRFLGMDAIVVYPPCDTSKFKWQGQQDYYLSTARMDSLKRVDVIIKAFLNMPEKKLIVISNGCIKKNQNLARNAKNICFLEQVSEKKLLELIGNCIATVYVPIEEDFGMSPVESMSAGKPVIGVAEGGLTETVIHNKTGLLLDSDCLEKNIIKAVMEINASKALKMREACEKRASLFDIKSFTNNIKGIILNSHYKTLMFPLNVYALALYMEEGRLDYLHYGLFSDKKVRIREAQQFSTDLLIKYLPAPPCNILEIGIGFGTTLHMLVESGYNVTGITPEYSQFTIAKKKLEGKAVKLECVSFESYINDSKKYSAIIMQESFQYIDPLYVFNKSFDLLEDNGLLIIIDEVCLKRKEPGIDNLPFFKHMQAQAIRCGYLLEKHINLSEMAIPTLPYLLKIIDKHNKEILDQLNIDKKILFQLISSLKLYYKKYQNGCYGYVMLSLKKEKPPQWRISGLYEKDASAMRELFNTVFGHEITHKFWEWKYANNRGRSVIACHNNKAVAHYGGLTRDIFFKGKPEKAIFPVDVMVLPEKRNNGLFFLTASTFIERNLGYGTPHLIACGFPNRKAMQIGEQKGLYKEVGKIVKISWPIISNDIYVIKNSYNVLTCLNNLNHKQIDILWNMMRADLNHSIIVVRNYNYINYRYLKHPEQSYDIFLISDMIENKPLGLIILKQEEKSCLLMDIVGPLKNFSLLIEQARRLCKKKSMYTWITETYSQHFEGDDSEIYDLDIRVPTGIWTSGPDPESIKGLWWLTAGDTDFL
ncbi:Glycosyl transferase, group 1 domain protein [Candidatus Magnetomorum sp. HK-1]|nr:Glycosyl transferase, group 1 domain protein [Candidatus Magnetomorum sp. HK-1]